MSEKAMATHSSTLAWKIPWVEEPGRLQFVGSLRVRHDWATSLSLFTVMHWRRKWQPTPVSCLENPRDGGAWWAAIYGVAQSRTWLKWLSSSNSSSMPVLSRVQFFVTLWTTACQSPLSMGYPRQEYWCELPCDPPGGLPDPGIKSPSLALSHALQTDSLPLSHKESPCWL